MLELSALRIRPHLEELLEVAIHFDLGVVAVQTNLLILADWVDVLYKVLAVIDLHPPLGLNQLIQEGLRLPYLGSGGNFRFDREIFLQSSHIIVDDLNDLEREALEVRNEGMHPLGCDSAI